MKLRKTAAFVTSLSFIAAVSLSACGHDPLTDDAVEEVIVPDAPEITTEAEPTEAPTSATEPVTEKDEPAEGDTFTIVGWNPEDAPILIANWLGIDADDFIDSEKPYRSPAGADIRFVCFNTGGYDAPDYYDRMFNSGDDIDVYLCEPDWALRFLNDDSRSLPLSRLDVTSGDIADMYPYTVEQCRDINGVLKALAWGASPGCFMYRTDLADQYLGVKTPDEMQSLVSDWGHFADTAERVAKESEKKTALADSLNGMWNAYSCGRSAPYVSGGTLELSDEIMDFADMAKKLWDCGGVTHNGQWTDDWYTAGTDGSCMGYFVPSWGFEERSFAMGISGGNMSGKWAVCNGPQAYYWGGTMLAVNPASDNMTDSRDLIRASVFDTGNLRKYASQASYLPNNMSLVEELTAECFTFSDEVSSNISGQIYYANLDSNARAIDLSGKITEYDADISTAVVNAIENIYLRDGADWNETMGFIKDDLSSACPGLDIR